MLNRQWRRKRFFWTVLLSDIVLLCIGSWMISYGNSFWICVLQYVLPLLSIILAWLLVSLPGRVVNNRGLLILFFLALTGFGIFVYSNILEKQAAQPIDKSIYILYPINNTLSLFFPSRGDSPDPSLVHTFKWYYYLLNYLAYFFFAWVGFSLFGRRLLNRTSMVFIRYRHRNIMWGYSEGALELAKDIIANATGEEPVFIINDDVQFNAEHERQILYQLGDESILAISTNFDKLSTDPGDFNRPLISWRKMMRTGKYFGAHRHYFITENQDHNVKMAFLILNQIKLNIKRIHIKTHLYIRTEQPGIDAFFQQELDACPDLRNIVEIHLFNQSDLTARRFVMNNPLLKLAKRPDFTGLRAHPIEIDTRTCTVNGELNILILGLGWTGFELLNKIVCDASYIGDFRLNIIVIDDDYRHKHGHYIDIVTEASHHGVNICINPRVWINANHEIRQQSLDNSDVTAAEDLTERFVHTANGVLFYKWLTYQRNIMRFNRIIVALGNDELNINTALTLHRFRLNYLTAASANDPALMPEPIFAHVRDKESYKYYKNNKAPISTFGSMTNIYKVNVIINEETDTIAKMVNYAYCRYDCAQLTSDEIRQAFIDGSVDKCWDQCTLFDQDSSRAVAMNIQNVIDIAGGDSEFALKLTIPPMVDRLGEMEHKRWNAFHFMRGIRRWDFDAVEPVIIDGKIKKNGKLVFGAGKILVKHICLVPFDELDKASATINRMCGKQAEDYKASDRRIIRHFLIFKHNRSINHEI